MVHDPRVTHALARLGGVYRDPNRVDRDAASLLKSSIGAHLVPIISAMIENNGQSSGNVLVLQGTIAVHFRGQTYQQLVDIYLPGPYPNRPPICFVRLASPNMYLKENHRHVGVDGKIYLPYLHEWNRNTHNLIEMVVAMSSVFSADPPVFTRATPTPPAPPPPPPISSVTRPITPPRRTGAHSPPPPYQSSIHQPYVNVQSSSAAVNTTSESEREALMQVEIAQANEAAEVARRAEAEEQERIRLRAMRERETLEQRKREEERTKQVKIVVDKKLRTYLLGKIQECQQQLQSDARDAQRLELTQSKIMRHEQLLQAKKDALQKHVATTDTKIQEIRQWLDDNKKAEQEIENSNKKNGMNGHGPESQQAQQQQQDIDDVIQPSNPLHGQMIELSAENATLSDALYYLDRALYRDHLSVEAHLKQVRTLAKKQFFVRAHMNKIHQRIMTQKQNQNQQQQR